MKTIPKRLISWLILFTFTFQSVFVEAYVYLTFDQFRAAPVQTASSTESSGIFPTAAFAEPVSDFNSYTSNTIPGNFVDISLTGNKLTLNYNHGLGGIPIGFDFLYFGNIYNNLTVTSNGYITFSTEISNQNTPLPSTQTPNNLIAPFWDDLNPTLNPGSGVYYETMGAAPHRVFVVQWDKLPLTSDPLSRLTFEVIFFENSHEIQFHYLAMTDGQGQSGTGFVSGRSASIGLENAFGNRGKEVAYNRSNSVTENTAFSFTLGGTGFAANSFLGDLDSDQKVTILDQSHLTDSILNSGKPGTSSSLLLADIVTYPGSKGRTFGDGKIDKLDHARMFEAIMGREELNPLLTGISSSRALPGTSIDLSGSGFDSAAADNRVVFTNAEDTWLVVTPAAVNSNGTGLTVTVPVGFNYITSVHVERHNQASNRLFFVAEGKPVITSLAPAGGKAGDTITIRGYEFAPLAADNLVSFNGKAAFVTGVNTANDVNELGVVVPAGVMTGPVSVAVGSETSNSKLFTVDALPVVAITSPVSDSEITAPASIIGTASDFKLKNYTLQYAPLGNTGGETNFTTIATGYSSVNNGVLGIFDPTMLLNGLYTVKLTAVDEDGQMVSISEVYRVTGDLKVGNFSITIQDLAIPVAGIPITLNRTYDSRDKGSHDFGYGWSIDIQTTKVKENKTLGLDWSQTNSGGAFPTYYLQPDGERYVTVTMPDGRMEEFDVRTEPEYSQFLPFQMRDFTLKFVPLSGTTSSLRFADSPLLYLAGTDILDLDMVEPFDPTRFILTDTDGTEYRLDKNAGLLGVKDTSNNSLTINANGIIHSSGKSISFTRDAKGRITRITDPMGNAINYTYNTTGDLITVSDQENNITQYTYNSTHGLYDIIDSLGRRAVRNEYDSSGRLVAQIDADGKRIEYTHNIGTRQEIIKDRLGNTTVLEYDEKGKIVMKTDPLGNKTSYTYDAKGNKTSETDPLGNKITWTYDAKNNKLTETKLANGQTVMTRWTYNPLGKVLTVTDPRNNWTVNEYDGKGNLTKTEIHQGAQSGPLINQKQFSYDDKGNVKTQTIFVNGQGHTTQYEYDIFGNKTKEIDPSGHQIIYTYDTNGNRKTQTVTRTVYTYTAAGLVATGTETLATSFEYDKLGRLLITTDPDGTFTEKTYDVLGRQIASFDKFRNKRSYEYDRYENSLRWRKTTYADGKYEEAGYDAENRRIKYRDTAGREMAYEYDKSSKLVKTVYPPATAGGQSIISENHFNAAGRIARTKDALGNLTEYEYNEVGQRTAVLHSVNGKTLTTTFGYDLYGNQTSVTDPRGKTTLYEYDAMNRLIKTTFPPATDGGQSTSIEVSYDELDRIIAEKDQAGKVTRFVYDLSGQLIKVIQMLAGQELITSYEYDESGNRISQTDAEGHTTYFLYDGQGRETACILPDGSREQKEYDPVGNLIGKTDFMGRKTIFTYNNLNGQLETKMYANGDSFQFAYTDTGLRKTVRSSVNGQDETFAYSYNSRNELMSYTCPNGNRLEYNYDLNGNRKLLTVFNATANPLAIAYTYDDLNRLESVTDPSGRMYNHSYDDNGNRNALLYPNGTLTTYTYNNLNRLTGLKTAQTTGSLSLIQSYNLTLGPKGNRTKIVEYQGTMVPYTC